MNWMQIASGNVVSAVEISSYEEHIEEGRHVKLTFNLRSAPTQDIITQVQEELNNAGVTEGIASSTGNNLTVTYKKGFPWLAVIVGIVLGLVVLAVLIVGWVLFKEVVEVVGPGGTTALIWIAVVVTVVMLGFFLYLYLGRS
jgi:hypothetical protein